MANWKGRSAIGGGGGGGEEEEDEEEEEEEVPQKITYATECSWNCYIIIITCS